MEPQLRALAFTIGETRLSDTQSALQIRHSALQMGHAPILQSLELLFQITYLNLDHTTDGLTQPIMECHNLIQEHMPGWH